MSTNKGKQKRPILRDMPQEEIRNIREQYPEVNLRILRQHPQTKQWQTIAPHQHFATNEILSGGLEEWIKNLAGGGNYTIEVRDPQDPAEPLVPRFWISLPGTPLDPKLSTGQGQSVGFAAPQQPQQPAGMGPAQGPQPGGGGPMPMGGGGAMPSGGVQVPQGAQQAGLPQPQQIAPGQINMPPQSEMPNWARHYDAQTQWQIYYEHKQKQGQLPQGASVYSDQLALSQADQRRHELEQERVARSRLEQELEQARRELTELREKRQQEIADLEKQREKEHYESQIKALEAKIEQSQQNKGMSIDWVGLVSAAAPIVTAFVQSSKDQQNQILQQIAAQSQQKGSEVDWNGILTAAAPIVTTMLQNNGPEAQARILETKDQSKFTMLQMLQDTLAQQAQNDLPNWYPVVEKVLEAVGENVAPALQSMQQGGALPSGQGGGEAQGQQQQGAQPSTPQGQQTQPSGAGLDGTWEKLRQTDEKAAQETKRVMDHLPAESGFQTHEWIVLLFNIHSQLMPEELAPYLVGHLYHCRQFMLLPGAFNGVFERPREVITNVLSNLPIWGKDQDYCYRLVAFVEREILRNEGRLSEAQHAPASPAAPDEVHESGTAFTVEEPTEGETGYMPEDEGAEEPEPQPYEIEDDAEASEPSDDDAAAGETDAAQ